MTITDGDDVQALRALASVTPPPPSQALWSSVEQMRPVRTRIPLRTLLVVAAAACVFPVCAVALYPLRRDLSALPATWLVSVAVLWLTGFIAPLAVALLPRRDQVLPDGARAGRAAFLASLTLVLAGLLFTVDAPGFTILPKTTWDGFFHLWWHCIGFSLKVTIPTVIVGAVVLRRVAVANPARLGAAVGAAAGALSGLTLHGLCPYGGAPHVGLAHGGGVVVGALLGALWLPLLVKATAPPASAGR